MRKPGDPDFIKGYISTEHTVWCGRCSEWEQVAEPTLKGTIREVKAMGFRQHKEYGWLCPQCVKDLGL